MPEENHLPPPDRWARLAAEERRKQKRRDGFLILMLMLLAAVLVFLIRSSLANDEKRGKRLIERETFNNLRQIGLGLAEFEAEYGKFPDASTIVEVKKQTGTPLMLKDASSNDLFRQLLAGKFVQSERVFGAFEMNSKLPDGLDDKDTNALTAGECGFAYVLSLSATDDPSRPLVFGPVKPGTRSVDSEMIDGEVVVLFADASVHRFPLYQKGVIPIRGNVFDPSHPVWSGKSLEIKWPK